MHFTSILLSATLLGASAASKYGHLRPIDKDGNEFGCLGPNMVWKTSGKCELYFFKRWTDGEGIYWWRLFDSHGTRCGDIDGYQQCIEGASYKKWHYYPYLKDGDIWSRELVTGIPGDCEAARLLSAAPPNTTVPRVGIRFHQVEVAKDADDFERGSTFEDAKTTCTSTSTIVPTPTGQSWGI